MPLRSLSVETAIVYRSVSKLERLIEASSGNRFVQ